MKMKEEYKNIDELNPRANPFAKRMKQQITININQDTIAYFKNLAQETGVPYQNLINLYLADCAHNKRKPTWL